MTNTGLTDQYGRRLGAGRENLMLKNKLETQQLSYQGFFWDNRIVATLGWRRDKTNRATVQNGYAADPFTGLQPLIQDIRFSSYDSANEQQGDTKTKGVVARPFHRLLKLPAEADFTFFYNQSDTFQPNVSNFDPLGNAYPGAKGKGEDRGVRLDLFGGKFSLKYTQFENDAGPARAGNVPYNRFRFTLSGVLNRVSTLAYGRNNVSLDPNNPNMFPALGSGDPYWVTSYIHSEGDEISLDWNVTKNFQLRFNLNKQEVTESSIGLDWWAWLATWVPKYQALTFPEGGVANPRDLDGNGRIDTWTWATAWRADNNTQTLADWYIADVIQGSTGQNIVQALDGKANEFVRLNRFNLNWSYRFTEGRLKGLSIGGAFRHRASPLLSYGKKVINGLDAFDLDRVFKGKADNLWDLSINYRSRLALFGQRDYRLGLNIRNLWNTDGLYAKMVNIDGNPIRVGRVSEPRTFIFNVGFDL